MTTTIKNFIKGPAERLDFGIDWKLAPGEQVATSDWQVTPSDLTILATAVLGNQTSFWCENGTDATFYVATNTITTSRQDPTTGQPCIRVASIGIAVRA